MNCGEYSWVIDDPKVIKQIISASNTEKFESEIFEIGKLKWMVQVFLNYFLFVYTQKKYLQKMLDFV